MSIVPKETIEVIAQSIGISNLSSEVALALAPDVEYRLREIMQEAIKCMRHSKRTVLTAEDVDSALSMRNIEPIYGFASGDPLRFKKAVGHKDLFYLDDREVDFKDIINAPLPKAPLDTSVVAHWLAIEGVQPAVPENVPIADFTVLSKTKRPEHNKEDGLPVDLKLPVKHVLSRELQLYLDKITELAVGKPETVLFEKALSSLATDSGLNPLVPYFSFFIADQVPRSLNELPVLFALMRMVRSLLRNPHLHIENYLHQFMPSMLTCIVAKRLGQRMADNHWELRDFSAHLVALVCKRFGNMYHNLQTRLTKTLVHAFLDPFKAMTQHYGAIQGLSAFGPTVVRLLILPNLETYLQLLEPEMLLEKQKNEMKRKEAWRVYGALLCAAGNCLHDMLKAFPVVLTQPKQTALKINGKIMITIPNKRKADSNSTFQEPALKKHRASASTSGGGPTTPSGQMSNISNDSADTTGSARDNKNAKATANNNKTRNPLAQAWKEDVDAGKLLSSLFELFGERILTFVQPPEMSLFI